MEQFSRLRSVDFQAYKALEIVGALRIRNPQSAIQLVYNIRMSSDTLLDYMDNFYRHGGDLAYIHRRGYRTERWGYRAIADTASRFARELERREIGKGDRVLLWGDNCAEWVIAFLGCVMRGAVVVPMDKIARGDFAMRVARQVSARLAVCSREQSRQCADLPTLLFEELSETVAGNSAERYPRGDLVKEDLVQIVFTSGTTAEPKGVVITHANVIANLAPFEIEIRKYLKYERFVHPLRFLNLLPLSHVFGQFLCIFIPPLLGGIVIFQDSPNPSEVLRTIKRERVSVLVGVPRMLESLRDKIVRDYSDSGKGGWFERQFGSAEGEHFVKRWWRFRKIHSRFGWKFWAFISGGATLDSATEAFWNRLSFVVIQGYGLTETTALVSVNHPFKLGKGSIGQVLPGREVKLDASGEILVRGEGIASGYWQGKELRSVSGEDGWFRTGDVGELDANGMLYFKGRKKDVIVTPEGLNVYPEDLEHAIRQQTGVRDCVVVGLAREGNAEPCAVMILDSPSVDPEQVSRAANSMLAEFQHIRRWVRWPEEDFPRTSTQKPRTNLIHDYAMSQVLGKQGSSAPTSTLAELIERVTGRDPGRLESAVNLATDLNLSSLDRVELLSAIEDRYQVDLNESRFSSATTVGELEAMLRQPMPRKSDYEYPRWAQRWLTHYVRLLVYYLLSWPATMLMARPRIIGRENLEGLRGPILIVCNHVTQIDVGYVLAALPVRLRHRVAVAMWGEMLQGMRFPPADLGKIRRAWIKLQYYLVVALFNVFPLPQQTGFRESFAFAGESADRGYSIVVFPEGRRTQDGKLSPFRSGVGMLANRLRLPVVPIRIDGLFELKIAKKKLAHPGKVQVTIGSPLRFVPDTDPEALSKELESRMAAMQP